MTFMPAPGDQVYLNGRPSTVVDVLAVDAVSGMMWVRPQGGRPLSTPISDQWVQVVPHPTLPDLWHAVSATASSRGFASKALVLANLPPAALALLHLKSDATVDIEWIEAP